MKKFLSGAVALIALSFVASPALAQAGPAVDTIHVWGQLEESLAEELATYGSRLDVVTQEQIKDGGFNDAAQALQMLVPGLYLAPKNGAFDYVNASLLGGRRQDIIWLIDGVRFSNRLYTTTTPLDTIPAHMIEKIEVLKGGQGLFYGTSAVSGVINIITKGFTSESKGSLGAGVDSNEGRHLNGYSSGALGDHRVVVYASSDQAEGFQPFRTEDYQPSSTARTRGYDVTTFGVKYGYDFSDAMKLSANYQHTDARLDFAYAEDAALAYNDRDEDMLSAKLDWSPTDRFDFFAKAYYHTWDTDFTRLNNTVPVSGALSVVSDAEFWGYEDYGLNLLGQYALTDTVDLLAGVDHQNYSGQDQVFLIAEQTEYVTAPFAQVRWDVGVMDGLKLAAGIRHNIAKGNDTTTVWNLSGDLAINDGFYARGMVGTAFRLPDAYELYVNDPCCEQGNPNLVGEESTNIELGVGGVLHRFRWEVTGFSRKVENLIRIVASDAGTPTNSTDDFDTFDNNGPAIEVIGAELTVTAAITDAVSATFDWTNTQAEPEAGGNQLQDSPKDTAKINLDWDPSDMPVGAGVSLAYVGDVYDTVSAVGNIDHGDYVLVDLTGHWYLDRDRRHRVGVRIENALNEDYNSSLVRVRRDVTNTSYAAGNRGTERTFHVSYSVDF